MDCGDVEEVVDCVLLVGVVRDGEGRARGGVLV